MGRPRSDILAVTMPCFGTTHRTRSNAELLAQCLGATLRCVDITKSVMQHFEDIGHDAGRHDVVFENSQARARTQVLMDMANQAGGLVVGTGDLSELALGWATYNGDHMSMYGVNASVPKTLIRHIVRYEAGRTKDAQLSQVLLDILDTPVSPELLPAKDGEIAQKTEDLVGPYELHDFFLYYAVRWGFSRPRCTAWRGAPLAGPIPPMWCFIGSKPSTGASLTSSLSALACRTAPRWVRLPCRPEGIGACPAMPAPPCGKRSWSKSRRKLGGGVALCARSKR